MTPPRAPKQPPPNVKAYRVAGREDDVIFVWRTSAPKEEGLTDAERAILELVVRGRSNREIAELRATSIRTVANQVATLLRKLGASSRYELLSRYG